MDRERQHVDIQLPAGSWWDWDVITWNAGEFRLAAGHDLTYHHGLELVFGDPAFVSCPAMFHDPVFRVLTSEELARVARQLGEETPVLVAFDADAGGREPVSCLIAAERFEVVHETVLRYWRDDAAPGQRFASWVRPPVYITDDMGKRSVRTAPFDEGRRLLIVTGEDHTPGTGDSRDRFLRLDAWMHDHFPVGDTAYRWAAQDNDVSDGVPLVGPFHPGARHVYVATGFGGWGMSGGAMAGQLLASTLTGSEPEWAGLYDPRRLWSTIREGAALLKQQAEVARHFVGDRLRTTHVDSVAEIAPSSGSLVRVDGQRCAVYRDKDGAVHAVSARCTPLGCLVAFNEAETAWECPCHGSRFSIDGEVLHGPALRPLPPRTV